MTKELPTGDSSNSLYDYSNWNKELDLFRNKIISLAEERQQRLDFIDMPDGTKEVEWVLYEREQTLDLINQIRSQRKLPAISMDHFINDLEQLAIGHSDYAVKLAVASVHVSHGRDPRNPDKEYCPQ